MTKDKATAYLAEACADVILNFPLTTICGEDGPGRPDKRHVRKLLAALMAVWGDDPSMLNTFQNRVLRELRDALQH